MKTLCKLIGGSNLYGLSNESSDLDYRGVFCNTKISEILGLDRFDCIAKMDNFQDTVLFEIRHFLTLTKKTNSQVLEILFAPKDKFLELDKDFEELVLDNKHRLINTERFFYSIKNYMLNEKKLVFGEKAGKMGKKRYEATKKYGYSPKNFYNLYRLARIAVEFFKTGEYIVDCKRFEEFDIIKQIRETPEKFSVADIENLAYQWYFEIENAFDSRDQTKDLTFNEEYANFVLSKIYKPYLP